MKNQDIFPSEFFKEIFQEKFSNAKKFFREIFQQNFLESFPESVIKNFNRGVDFFATQAKETTTEFTEGGIRIQENRPKNGGREEA